MILRRTRDVINVSNMLPLANSRFRYLYSTVAFYSTLFDGNLARPPTGGCAYFVATVADLPSTWHTCLALIIPALGRVSKIDVHVLHTTQMK